MVNHITGQILSHEELTVIKDLGVQLRSVNLAGKVISTNFIDISRVRDFVLNESMSYFKLDMYLAFIVEREDKMVIPFDKSVLSQKELIQIYATAKKFL